MLNRKRLSLLLSTLIALVAIIPYCACAQTALVTDLRGGVAQSGSSRLTILSQLNAGAQIQLNAGARLTLAHISAGRQYDVEGPGVFKVTVTGVETEGGGKVVAHAPFSSQFKNMRLRLGALAQASISMRGVAGEQRIHLHSPVSSWVLETRPSFSWQKVPDAKVYRFKLTDDTGRLLFERSVTDDVLNLPDTITLRPGQIYAWQISAAPSDGTTLEGWTEFGIVSAELRARMEEAQPAENASLGDRVLYALLLEDSGMRDVARSVWDGIARDRPDEPRLQNLAGAR